MNGLLVTLPNIMQFYNILLSFARVFIADHAEFVVMASQNTASNLRFNFKITMNQIKFEFFFFLVVNICDIVCDFYVTSFRRLVLFA